MLPACAISGRFSPAWPSAPRHGSRSSRSVAGAPSSLAGSLECHLPELRAAGRATRGARSWDSSSTLTSATTGASEIKRISTASWIDLTTRDEARSTIVSARALAEVTRQQTGCQSSTAKGWRRSWGRDGQCFGSLTAREPVAVELRWTFSCCHVFKLHKRSRRTSSESDTRGSCFTQHRPPILESIDLAI